MSSSYFEHMAGRLDLICRAFAIEPDRQQVAERILGTCMQSWNRSSIGRSPPLLSDITDDHSPFEYSLAFRPDGVDIRFLVEPQPATPKIESRWDAGMALVESIQREHACHLSRFHEVADLFQPSDHWARFALWVAVSIGANALFKIYLNPAGNGAHNASRTVRAALRRLGLEQAWSSVPELRRGLDEVKYFSLDLVDDARARVKVYFSHRNVDVDFLEMMLSRAPGYVPGSAEAFCRKLSGGKFNFDGLPVQTCYSFIGSPAVEDVALHFPVRSYARDDGEALGRVSSLLGEPRRTQYRDLVRALTGDPSRRGGAQTYASLWSGQPREVTIYLSPQLYLGAKDAARTAGAA
jgi:hypothetical protein